MAPVNGFSTDGYVCRPDDHLEPTENNSNRSDSSDSLGYPNASEVLQPTGSGGGPTEETVCRLDDQSKLNGQISSPPSEAQATCTRLPDTSGGKRCKFYVYDDSADGALGAAWKWGAKAEAIGGSSYSIPSSKNMEQTLHELLSVYAEKGCDCTDEIQFWGHGSSGNGGWISQQTEKGTSELNTKLLNIPGVDQFGDDPGKPGYREWSENLTPVQSRLVLLRRTICDSDSEVYYRSCQGFRGQEGIEFAKASSEFWRCDVTGHTKLIGLTQPGKHTLPVCTEPDWDASEGATEEGKKDKEKLREVKPR